MSADGRATTEHHGEPRAEDTFWSDELEELHEESSRTHFLDVWTRTSMLERLGPLRALPTVVDLGCSTGYLLEDLRAAIPGARLVGLDYVFAGLPGAQANVATAALLQGDVCRLPLGDASADAIVSANLLEHVPDDRGALAEIRRVLRPGARAVIVVPAAPGAYDYYDRFLHHQRRYGQGELADKARSVGLDVLDDVRLGSLIYPAFWLVKKRNRLLRDHLRGEALKRQVAADIAKTKDSRLGHVTAHLERRLLKRGVVLPFGIRQLAVLERRPIETSAS
ncbi:MAG TPA: class I SAM-dependent methyltransferase [Acidimicrobiales bacterium]|nr:class I SAM-dependent methyltransferase [Acidimicrobiales bacterium]